MVKDYKASSIKKMSRCIITVLSGVCIILGGLCGCYETPGNTIEITDGTVEGEDVTMGVVTGNITEVTTVLNEDETTALTEEVTTASDDNVITGKVLSPESAVDIYMNNINVWMEMLDYQPMNGYGYCLIDIDLDGTLELISSVCDGTGRFSSNKYFRINPESRSVEEILLKDSEINCTYDYYLLGCDDTMLLKDKISGEVFYICTDFIRATGFDFSHTRGKMNLEDGSINIELIFDEYKYRQDPTQEDFDIIEYYLNNGDKFEKVSEEEYIKKEKALFDSSIDLKVFWESVQGGEFAESDEATRRQLLLDAYRAFSYDGFSFANAEVYDLP